MIEMVGGEQELRWTTSGEVKSWENIFLIKQILFYEVKKKNSREIFF
jgi:hypothetical protein